MFFGLKKIARQKEVASNSVTELVEAVKKPRSRALSESTNRPFLRKSGDHEIFDAQTRRSSGDQPPARRHSHAGTRTSMQKITEHPEKPQKKAARRSFMAYITGKPYPLCSSCKCAMIKPFVFDVQDSEEGETGKY